TTAERTRFDHLKEIDLGYGVKGVGRFRVNIFQQRGSIRIVARVISDKVPEIEDLNLPQVVLDVANRERGLILVTGATGSGKSTTLAAMIQHINLHKNKHIITIEDPIEFLIRDHRSLISQREIGLDTTTFAAALRAALRQDPDVILIGEMRDKETIETALVAAETGHLVFSTLHTYDAQETINRILAVFEPHQQLQVRRQLAATLRAVISQRLATRKDGKGVIPVIEIMVNNARIREMIEDPEKTNLITEAIETSAKETGMQSFDQSLLDLVFNKSISLKEALTLSNHPDDFYLKYTGIKSGHDQQNPVTQKGFDALPSFPGFDLDDDDHDD
ncbi:MAG: PilT/PilU family type 4a pilus ATPase, partial [Bdellovibrionales bacterium]|nr:PilT/PilU family type 4a pilus ATPase [Bdellovibrionales bacterium]